jgi:hypothetical protein
MARIGSPGTTLAIRNTTSVAKSASTTEVIRRLET